MMLLWDIQPFNKHQVTNIKNYYSQILVQQNMFSILIEIEIWFYKKKLQHFESVFRTRADDTA